VIDPTGELIGAVDTPLKGRIIAVDRNGLWFAEAGVNRETAALVRYNLQLKPATAARPPRTGRASSSP
jgi:hypothetical protein